MTDRIRTKEQPINRLFLRLKELCTDQSTQSQIEDLARLFIRLTITYLRVLECKGQRIRETRKESEFEQLASDCIADLFKRDKNGAYCQLQTYFLPLFDTGAGPEEIYTATLRLLIQRSQQQLTQIYRQRDPEGAKLRRQLTAAIQKHPHLTLKHYVDGYYVTSNLSAGGPVREPDDHLLGSLLTDLLHNQVPVSKILPLLFEQLSQLYQSPVALPLTFVQRFIRSYRTTAQEVSPHQGPETELDGLFYARLVETALSRIKQILLRNYVHKGKLTSAEAAALYEALAAKSQAALDGEDEFPDITFVQKNWPAAIGMHNPKKIQSIFDYLLRIFRRDLQQKIKKYF